MGHGHDCSAGAGPSPAERRALVEAQLYVFESLSFPSRNLPALGKRFKCIQSCDCFVSSPSCQLFLDLRSVKGEDSSEFLHTRPVPAPSSASSLKLVFQHHQWVGWG